MGAVTLQVTLAPYDVRHARHTLGHLVRTWGPQVDEVLLVIDHHESPFRARGERSAVARALVELEAVIDAVDHSGLRVVRVERSPAIRRRVAERFGARRLPESDFRGRPYYSYLFGLAEARHPQVLHVDSDMMFGGGSMSWTEEATSWFTRDESLIAVSPLPGPPTADGHLRGQEAFPHVQVAERAYRFENLSTRVFLADLERFEERLGSLAGRHVQTLRSVVGSTLRHQINWLPLEARISLAMGQSGSGRLDLLGAGEGMWSLHPLVRSNDYYEHLPAIIQLVEAGAELPASQCGHYELHETTVAMAAASQR